MVAMAIFILASAVLVPSFDRIAPKYLKVVTSFSFSPFMVMSALRADLHPVCSSYFIESVGEILKFTAGAIHEVNVISEYQVTDRSSPDRD
ncbi:hypothetical protein DPMN_007268 [Dreissena polymorpha]|uniref:Uncharacterized protein n=1 Tax=Dreissena polymorpha TaxID=45954 RepID=A0A9D4MX30_DREPO|nr:hypothetical protein DPMN_007268 [Dreissena polymorpha]